MPFLLCRPLTDLANSAGSDAFVQQIAYSCIAREGRSALELCPGFVKAAELCQEIAANAGQEMVALEGRLGGQPIDELEAFSRTECHRHGNGAVQLDHRRRSKLRQFGVELGDAGPVGLLGAQGARA